MDINSIITIVASIIGSGGVSAVITTWMNNRTQINAIRESGLYEKRAKVVDEFMGKINDVHSKFLELIKPDKEWVNHFIQERCFEDFEKAYIKFDKFFSEKQHYLGTKLANKIFEMKFNYKYLADEFKFKVNAGSKNTDHDKWSDILLSMEDNISKRKYEIAQEFRKMMGVK